MIAVDLLYKKKISMIFYETFSRNSSNCLDSGVSLRTGIQVMKGFAAIIFSMEQVNHPLWYLKNFKMVCLCWCASVAQEFRFFGKYHDHPIRRLSSVVNTLILLVCPRLIFSSRKVCFGCLIQLDFAAERVLRICDF